MHLKSVTLHPEKYPNREYYPFCLPLFQRTSGLTFKSPITMFVGENGTGKSTLLEAVARKCGIHIWRDEGRARVERNPYREMLPEYLSVEWADGRMPGSFFSASVFQDFAEMIDEWAAIDPGQLSHFGGKSLITQSHGQSVMSFLSARCKIKGIYFFDEPEAALSPKTQLDLVEVIREMASAGHAQFVIATHSPIILGIPGADLWSFDQIPLASINYRDTEHFKVYKQFLNADFGMRSAE